MRFFYFIKDWLTFGKHQGYIFALKYKLFLAKEGKDFTVLYEPAEED